MANQPPQYSRPDADFLPVLNLILEAKARAWSHVNSTLIHLYWRIGEYVSLKTEQDQWGQGTVQELSQYLISEEPSIRGYSARNIWRMKKFFETYREHEKLSTVLTEIAWSNHLHILSKTKTFEEKLFYLDLLSQRNYPARDLARLIDSSTYERTQLANQKLSTPLTVFPGQTKDVFKDLYVFEFLNLPEEYHENDLRRALIQQFRKFLLELGTDFSLIGEEYTVQVGNKDFRIDLLMHHRGLNCLVAIELKTTDFQPAHLGQLQFYLEALDKDIKKDHENPSIGILICKTKDDEVVRYALNRHISPTLIAEYETQLPNKELLQAKLHELTLSMSNDEEEAQE